MKTRISTILLLTCTLFVALAAKAENRLSISDYTMSPGEERSLPIELQNTDEVTALQFRLTLPDELTLDVSSVKLTDRSDDHQVRVKEISKGQYLFMIYSPNSKLLKGTSGNIVVVNVKMAESAPTKKKHDIDIDDVVLSTANGTAVEATASAGSITSVTKYSTIIYNNVEYRIVSDGKVEAIGTSNFTNAMLDLPQTFYFDGMTYTVITIADNAFSSDAFTVAQIPNSVVSIGENAFASDNLRIVYTESEMPAAAAINAFGNAKDKLLLVKEDCKDIYAHALEWQEFGAVGFIEPLIYDNSLFVKADFVSRNYRCTNKPALDEALAEVWASIDATRNMYKHKLTELAATIPPEAGINELLLHYNSLKQEAYAYASSAAWRAVDAVNMYMPDLWFVDITTSTYLVDKYANTIGATKERAQLLIVVGKTDKTLDFEQFLGMHANYVNVDCSSATAGDISMSGCKSVVNVILPQGLSRIASGTFDYCYDLRSLTVNKQTPPAATDASFGDIDCRLCRLYVPVGARDYYKSAAGWSGFFDIKEEGEGVVVNGNNVTIDNWTFSRNSSTGGNGLTLTAAPQPGEDGVVAIPDYVMLDGAICAVSSVEAGTFSDNAEVSAIVFPQAMENIGANTVVICPNLTEVTLTGEGTMAEAGAFSGCERLNKVVVRSAALASADFNEAYNLPAIFGKQVKNYVLDGCTERLGDNIFYGASEAQWIDLTRLEGCAIAEVNRSKGALAGTQPSTLIFLNEGSTATGENVVGIEDGKRVASAVMLYEGRSFSSPYAFTAQQFAMQRTFTIGKPTALCLPVAYDVEAMPGEVFTFSGFGAEANSPKQHATACFERMEGQSSANVPHIIVPTAATLTLSDVEVVAVSESDALTADNTFFGTYQPFCVGDEEVFAFDEEQSTFTRQAEGSIVPPLGCYLTLTGSNTDIFAITLTGSTTRIATPTPSTPKEQANWYTATGTRIATPHRGINIVVDKHGAASKVWVSK